MTQSFDTPEDVLAHFGVKGMRWGVRRSEDHTTKLHREAHADVKRLEKSAKSSLGAVYTKAHKQLKVDIQAKKDANPDYAQAYSNAEKARARHKEMAHNVLFAVGALTVIAAMSAPTTRRTANQGAQFVRENRSKFNATVNNAGVYNITTLRQR